jgi:hypothetical protein
VADLYAVKNTGKNIITISGHPGIHPGEVEVLDEWRKDKYASDFPGDVKVTEYTPEDKEGDHVLELSISDLEDALETGEYDDRLEALLEDEKERQDRKGAKEAINDRIDELSEGE